jgi:hypothetical protein
VAEKQLERGNHPAGLYTVVYPEIFSLFVSMCKPEELASKAAEYS